MPRIHTLSNCRIYIYADDHAPPHFHALGPEAEALIRIETMEVMRGTISRADYAEVTEWAKANVEALLAKWSEYNERD